MGWQRILIDEKRHIQMAVLSTLASPSLVLHSFRGMGADTFEALRRQLRRQVLLYCCGAVLLALRSICLPDTVLCATVPADAGQDEQQSSTAGQRAAQQQDAAPSNLATTKDWNRRLKELLDSHASPSGVGAQEYQIGVDDLLSINVFEAQELNRDVRVSAGGEISLPLLGAVRAGGLTPRELEIVLQELLHRTYMKDPHVSVFVREVQSHPVSVMGAVKRPGVFQIRGNKTLLEVLSLAEGLADDAGDTVIILRGAALNAEPSTVEDHFSVEEHNSEEGHKDDDAEKLSVAPNDNGTRSKVAVQVNLRDLLESADSRSNTLVHPGDIVKVTRAGIVYVIGEVRRPGGFALKSNENISVLQALALSEGLTPTASKGGARIIHTNQQSGERKETPIDLGKILAGKAPDPVLESKDIVFVPNSASKHTLNRGAELAAQTLAGLLIFHW
jgi:polysaccharide export outer membrane protein